GGWKSSPCRRRATSSIRTRRYTGRHPCTCRILDTSAPSISQRRYCVRIAGTIQRQIPPTRFLGYLVRLLPGELAQTRKVTTTISGKAGGCACQCKTQERYV